MTKGIITDIHRTSVVDGPGLRTTVFLKGCQLNCIWCHNPETQHREIELAFDIEKATHDELSMFAVSRNEPVNAFEQTQHVLDHAHAIGVNALVENCPSGAFFLYGREVTVGDVVSEVLKDRDYYQNSGGGITVSGGEPMMQPEFALAILRECKNEGIHTVLDTSGFMSRSNCEKTLKVTDLYLFDYKASDDETHRRLTGVPLRPILDNLDFLYSQGAEIILRCPVIPGINDNEAHLESIIQLQQKYPLIRKVDILTWHTMGKTKYTKLGRETPDALPLKNTSENEKSRYNDFFRAHNIRNVEVL